MEKLTITIIALVSMLSIIPLQALELKDLPNPLKDAKIGEWVLYESPGNIKMKQEIINVSPEEITLKMTMSKEGKKSTSMESKIPKDLKKLLKEIGAKNIKITKGNITVKGKELNCYILESEFNGMKSKTFMSVDIPVSGLIQSDLNGKTSMKLIDFK